MTWKSVWIGVASSCLTGGLVDGSALLEVRRRDRAVLRIAGVRVGYLHQRLLWTIDAVFDVSGEPELVVRATAVVRSLAMFSSRRSPVDVGTGDAGRHRGGLALG